MIIRIASVSRDWGYDRIAGALANLEHEIPDQTVGNVLRRHGRQNIAIQAMTDLAQHVSLGVRVICALRTRFSAARCSFRASSA